MGLTADIFMFQLNQKEEGKNMMVRRRNSESAGKELHTTHIRDTADTDEDEKNISLGQTRLINDESEFGKNLRHIKKKK